MNRALSAYLYLALCFTVVVGASPTHKAKNLDADLASAIPACANLNLLIPLYSYPNWYDSDNYIWDDIAAANSLVPITAIINPNNGPGGCPPNSDYQHGLDDLRSVGVSILGYVYTGYGGRDAGVVKADIDLYNLCFNIDGIFFDEAASNTSKLAYYSDLYSYVKSSPNLGTVVLNPGTHTDEGYFSQPATDIAVLFESSVSDWTSYVPDAYVDNYPNSNFAMLAYDTLDANTVCSAIALANSRNFGYVYLTDDTLPNPWDSLPPFWEEKIACIETLNTCAVWLPLIFNDQ